MIKVWDSFSILIVMALLVLLAPTAVLLGPAASVAEGAVLQEVEATFSLPTVNTSGAWDSFTAGSGDRPVTMEQFTRDNHNRGTELSGCDFREYSHYNGSVSGGLSGSMRMKFNMWDFAMTYPYTPIYQAGTDFGTMFGRGYINDTQGTFYFVFVIDLDGDAQFSNAAGKGQIMSYDETGDYAGHKLIGEIEMDISSGGYNGSMHLRNYDPSEIVSRSTLHISRDGCFQGQNNHDEVGEGKDLVYFDNYYGDYHTEQSGRGDAGLEEVDFGQEPDLEIDSGPLGSGGIVHNSRNSFIDAGVVFTSGQLEGVLCINLRILDTYAQTGDDGSSHGNMYPVMLLDMPYARASSGSWVAMNGYLLHSFDMPTLSTEDYAGVEMSGLAELSIKVRMSSPYDARVEADYFELRPTPKPVSCSPSSGDTGTSLEVTIPGKYFLRAGPDADGASISFGPGITVDDWRLANESPLDNAIIANITIDGGATLGLRTVNVTSCFGYGGGDEGYASGLVVDGFEVTGGGEPTLDGQLTFPGTAAGRVMTVRFFDPGTHAEEGWSPKSATTDATGNFTITTGLVAGTYDVSVKNHTCLSEVELGIVLVDGTTTYVNFGSSREGDSDNSDGVSIVDISILIAAYGTTPGDGNWNANCDYNRDSGVSITDISILIANYGDSGDPYPP